MLKKFWIVTNDGKDTNHAVTGKVRELLEIAGRSCILCEKDFRKKYINPLMSCKLVEVQGEGVLPTSPTIKDIIVKRIQDYALAV